MRRILIVEDDLVVSNIYAGKFRGEGFLVEVAHDGLAAKQYAESFKPELVILDLVLPKLNGVELIKYLRAEAQFKTVPIVVFSNSYLSNLVQDAWKAGATKCLSKIDCTPKQLIEVVGKLLQPAPPAATPAPSTARPPHTPPTGVQPPADVDSDEAFQAELRTTFLEGGAETLGNLRSLLQAFTRAEADLQRLARLQDLARQARLLSGNAGIVGLSQMSRLAAAFEALLRALYEKPRNISASTMRTAAQTVDFLATLFAHSTAAEKGDLATANTLVVDDEIISRRAVNHSLERAGLKSVSVEDPLVALQLLSENFFDLVILDVEMPQMDGFALCTRLRALPQHATTPVLFVTSHTDFESRAKSIMSGGNDLIAKPFLFMELAVKALTLVLRRRLGKCPPPKRAAG
jgi:DNA-binding response OmpR family regulator